MWEWVIISVIGRLLAVIPDGEPDRSDVSPLEIVGCRLQVPSVQEQEKVTSPMDR